MSKWKTVVALSVLLSGVACASSKVDPRCSINAPNARYRAKLARSVNGSKLWQTYFDLMMPSKEGAIPIISVDLDFDRKITRKTNDDICAKSKVWNKFRQILQPLTVLGNGIPSSTHELEDSIASGLKGCMDVRRESVWRSSHQVHQRIIELRGLHRRQPESDSWNSRYEV